MIIENGISLGDSYDKEQTGILLNIPIVAALVLGSIIAMFIVDNLGRRWIMLRSLPIIFLAQLMIALSMYLSLYSDDEKTQSNGHYLFFSSVVLFVLAFAIGFGSTPWIVNSEIYPLHLIDTAVALATATN